MAGNSITLFGSDPPTGANSYVQDAFSDITDLPNNNTGWSSTVSNNPMNNLYGNDDFPRYGAKTLWVKDLVLEPNRINWIQGQPTYRVIWNEPFPSAQGYVFGNVHLVHHGDQTYIALRSVGDGFGVGGVFVKAGFLLTPNTTAAATAAIAVDGVVNTTVPDTSNLTNQITVTSPYYTAFAHAPGNETYQIHDYRLTANQAAGSFDGVMRVSGVIVYSENPSLSIDQFPGVTYNNKTRSASSANATLQVPSMGGSLGGVATIWKNTIGGYSMSVVGNTTIVSTCTGSSGTNLVTVATGQGASFSVGNGVISYFGSTPYIGLVQNISTDTLTLFPTLQISVSGPIFRYFQSGPSLNINASLNILAYTFGMTEIVRTRMIGTALSSSYYLDPYQNFYVWGNGFGMSLMDTINPVVSFSGSNSYLQCEGYFNGAEIEWAGQSMALLHGTFAINGFNSFNFNAVGATGVLKRTVFTDAGPGWNSFSFTAGASHTAGIARINLYRRNRDISASYGVLASFDTLQSYTPRVASNSTIIPPGLFKRTLSDNIQLGGSWIRTTGSTIPGGVWWIGSDVSCTAKFQYYGNHFSVLGFSLGQGASLNLSLDNGVNQGATSIGLVIQSASLGFHSVSLAVLGGTFVFHAIDFYRTYGEMRNLQTFSGVTSAVSMVNAAPIVTTMWKNYLPAVSGMGPGTFVLGKWRRVGPDMELKVTFQAGSVTGNTSAIALPVGHMTDGLIVDQFASTGFEYVGDWTYGGALAGATQQIFKVIATPYHTNLVLTAYGAGTTMTNNIGNLVLGSNGAVCVNAKVPIAGWYWDH